MARYRVLHESFLNNFLHQEGDIVEFEGEAGPNLELLEDEAAPKAHKAGGKSKTTEAE